MMTTVVVMVTVTVMKALPQDDHDEKSGNSTNNGAPAWQALLRFVSSQRPDVMMLHLPLTKIPAP